MMLWTPLLACSAVIGVPVTTGSLLRETYDLERLTRLGSPPHKLVQFSSYDHSSVAPYAPGWYANSDGFGGEPTPNFLETLDEPGADGVGRYLMAKVDGPGAIVRTWSAVHSGTMRVFLDGADTPLYDGPAEHFLVWTSRHFAEQLGLDAPEDDGFHQNQACYLPIPFAKGLRIEWIGKVEEIHFYHIETRNYAPRTEVTSFTPEDLRTYAKEYEAAGRALRGEAYPPLGETATHAIDATVPTGARTEVLRLEGPAEVAELTLRADAAGLTEALRQTIVRIHFDGAPQPQVEAPLGDLFGAGPGLNPYESLPFSVKPDGTMICRFAMPFAKSAVLLLENLGDQAVHVTGEARVRPREWSADSLHFHCTWDVDHDLVARGGDEAIDLPILNARGTGHFVGVAVMLLNPANIPTEGGNWWGEGDEKVWTDDDTFPSLFGTGSEDYFNYAWSRPDHFWHGYCAQPLNTGPGTRGLVANNRYHVLDAIPFERSIDFYIELFAHSPTPGFSYARSAYFYAGPSVRDRRMPITRADVHQALTLPYGWTPAPAGGATGATFFPAESSLAATDAAKAEVIEGAMWAGGKLVRWQPTAEGERLSFRVTAPEAGKYQIAMTAALSPRSGRFVVAIDGKQPGSRATDLFSPYHELLRNHWYDTVELTAGEHTVTLISAGRDARSAGQDVGVDFLWVVRR